MKPVKPTKRKPPKLHTDKPSNIFFGEDAAQQSAMYDRVSSYLEGEFEKQYGARIVALETENERLIGEIRKAYRDRAVRDAALAADYNGVMVVGGDPCWPEWGVFYYELSSGQVSSHVHPEELFLFKDFPHGAKNLWDGHSRELAHERYTQHAKTRLALWDAEGARALEAPNTRHRKVGNLVLPGADCD